MTLGFNWKMNPANLEEAKKLIDFYKVSIEKLNLDKKDFNLIIFSPFIYLRELKNYLKNSSSKISLGAQDGFFEDLGPFTSQVSIKMLREAQINYILIGHSEVRKNFGEKTEDIIKKIKKALELNMEIFYLFGEKNEKDDYKKVIEEEFNQIFNTKYQISNIKSLNFVYEPWWAISTAKKGHIASINHIKKVLKFIKNLLNWKLEIGNWKLYYGGSVDSNNIETILKIKGLNGVLVGQASLKKEEVKKIFEILEKILSP